MRTKLLKRLRKKAKEEYYIKKQGCLFIIIHLIEGGFVYKTELKVFHEMKIGYSHDLAKIKKRCDNYRREFIIELILELRPKIIY